MNDEWTSGSVNASYEISGKCLAGFWQSAEGTIRVEATDASFPRLLIAGRTDGLRASRLDGKANLHNGTIEIEDAHLEAPEGSYAVRGTATFSRELDLNLTHIGGVSYSIGGTLAEPRTAPISAAEQARLKTESR